MVVPTAPPRVTEAPRSEHRTASRANTLRKPKRFLPENPLWSSERHFKSSRWLPANPLWVPSYSKHAKPKSAIERALSPPQSPWSSASSRRSKSMNRTSTRAPSEAALSRSYSTKSRKSILPDSPWSPNHRRSQSVRSTRSVANTARSNRTARTSRTAEPHRSNTLVSRRAKSMTSVGGDRSVANSPAMVSSAGAPSAGNSPAVGYGQQPAAGHVAYADQKRDGHHNNNNQVQDGGETRYTYGSGSVRPGSIRYPLIRVSLQTFLAELY